MRMRLRDIANGVVLGAVAFMCVLGMQGQAGAVLPDRTDLKKEVPLLPDVATLEERAAIAPTAAVVTELAAAYLDRDQPGLASAVLDRAAAGLGDRPDIAQLRARALFGRGHAREALAVARAAHEACGEAGRCPSWLIAKTIRQRAFLEEVVAAGIDDAYANPEATMAAYERSTREVRLVAIR